MIHSQEIVEKCKRLYAEAVGAWLAGESSFFPKRIRASLSLPDDHSEAIQAVSCLRRDSKEATNVGYRVVWKEVKSRKHGLNRLPTEIWIDSMEDLAWLAKKQKEFKKLAENVAIVRVSCRIWKGGSGEGGKISLTCPIYGR